MTDREDTVLSGDGRGGHHCQMTGREDIALLGDGRGGHRAVR